MNYNFLFSYNPTFDVAISADKSGMVEYWSGLGNDYEFPKNVMFESKLDTDLFEFAKKKSYPLNISVSPNGKFFATYGSDRMIRIFRFLSGKLYCAIDESICHYIEMQQVKQMYPTMDFNRKISTDKELEKADMLKFNNVIFDKTSNFISYASLAGKKDEL
jgi:peptidylprolyl isomerase domain and WD repeat-containing protein 1